MTCSDAGKIGAARRREIDRAPILAKCAAMRVAMGMKAHVGLVPVLVLTAAERIQG